MNLGFLFRQIGRSIPTNWAVYSDKLGGLFRQIGRSIVRNSTVYCEKFDGLFFLKQRKLLSFFFIFWYAGNKKGVLHMARIVFEVVG